MYGPQRGGNKPAPFAVWAWAAIALPAGIAIVLAFTYVDVPLAIFDAKHLRFFHHTLEVSFAGNKLLTIEAVVIAVLVALRLLLRRLPLIAKTTAVACSASICAFLVNDLVLKQIFGVANPIELLAGSDHAFHFWQGTSHSGFPSGHMMLSGAFAGVFMQVYRPLRLPFAALLGGASILLVSGGWRFPSDIIAGVYLGLTIGFIAGYLFQIYEKRRHGPLKRDTADTISPTSQ